MNQLQLLPHSNALKNLRSEHLDGFLFTAHLRYGLAHNISTERLNKYTSWFWRNHMRPHFFQEENILLRSLSAFDGLSRQLKIEHEEILELVLTIDSNPDRHDFAMLANFVEKHMIWEQEVFFPHVEKSLSDEQLIVLGQLLDQGPAGLGEDWTDEFWKKHDA